MAEEKSPKSSLLDNLIVREGGKPLHEIKAGVHLNEAESKELLIVTTSENRRFLVQKRLLVRSPIVRDILSDADQSGDAVELPLLDMDFPTLELIVMFLQYHENVPMREIERPLPTKNLQELIDPWDYEFFVTKLLEDRDERKHYRLLDVLKAANFLILLPLRDFCCAALASMVMGKNEEEILALLDVKEPFTAKHEEQMYKDYPWLREKVVSSTSERST